MTQGEHRNIVVKEAYRLARSQGQSKRQALRLLKKVKRALWGKDEINEQ